MSVLDPRTIVSKLGGVVTGRDTCNVPGPGHSPADRSISVRIDPTAALGLKIKTFSPKNNWEECRAYVAAKLGIKIESGAYSQPLQLFLEAISARGTLAEKYLALRQLALPDRHEEVLKFHPSCPFGKGTRHPCMVALYRDIRTNEPKAVHRTALTPDAKKIDRKSLGPIGGCAIKLTADENVEQALTVGEGIETTLAGMVLNFRPAWALGSANTIAKFPVLPGIECLTILTDHDASGTGQVSALECSRRWTSMGREVFRVIPTAIGTDIADVVRGRAA